MAAAHDVDLRGHHGEAGCLGGDLGLEPLDGRGLIGGFLEAESFGEELVIVRLEAEGVPGSRRTLRVDVQQFRRRVVRLLRRLLFRLFPLAAAELVQRCRVGRRAAVAADEVQVRHGDVQLRVVGIDELQELVGAIAQVERQQAKIAPDTVLLVNHRIADAHLGQVAHHRVDVRALGRLACRPADDAGIQLGFRHEGHAALRPRETGGDRRGHEHHVLDASGERVEVIAERREQAVLGEVVLHRLATSGAFGDDRDAKAGRRDEALQRGERIISTTIDLDGRQGGRGSRGVATQLDAAETLDGAVEAVGRKK